MVKKAQGALEFLMTYGWAFLVILIMIGALAYFGILNPTRFLPDRCDFGTQILCKNNLYQIVSGTPNVIKASLTNNAGQDIVIPTGTMILFTDALGGFNCDGTVGADVMCIDAYGATPDDACGGAGDVDLTAADFTWDAGRSATLYIECAGPGALPAGDKVKYTIEYDWYANSAGATYTKEGAGEIYAQVQ